jgi:hypothetical protein
MFGSGLLLLLTLAACGGGSDKKVTASTGGSGSTPTPEAAPPGCAPVPSGPPPTAAAARRIEGDPPGSAATARLDEIMLAAKRPSEVSLFARRDLTNEDAASGDAELLQRFKDSGRLTGAQYILSVDGQQRISLGVNQYQTPAGAKSEFDRGKPNPPPNNKLDTTGLGDDAVAARITLGSGDQAAYVNNVVFIRGCYFVTMADFANDPNSKGESAIIFAKALDDALKAAK